MNRMTILDQIVSEKRKELEEEKRRLPLAELENLVRPGKARDFRAALQERPCALIAEVKKRSPSKGMLRKDFDPVSIASVYERCGAAAISVLTDKTFFGGEKADLIRVRGEVSLPVLRKDFIIDPYQVYETRLMGADAVLLIAAILGPALQDFLRLSESLGLYGLVEVHSEDELTNGLEAGAGIIGINNRDLRTFQTDLMKSVTLMDLVPEGITVVSESGIRTREDIRMLMGAGIHAFLVGESLMKADDVCSKIEELLAP